MRPSLVINGIDFNQRLDDARIMLDLSIDLIFTRDEYIKKALTFYVACPKGIKIKIKESFWRNVEKLTAKYIGTDPTTGYKIWEL